MDLIKTFLSNPITIAVLSGLTIGLLITLYILIKTRLMKNELEEEIADSRYDYRRLEEQMNRQMIVGAKAQEDLKAEIEEYKSQIANLETTVQTLSTKPGRKDLKVLQALIRTEEILLEKNPGAHIAWENAKKEAESEIQETEKGLRPMLRKVFGNEGSTNGSFQK